MSERQRERVQVVEETPDTHTQNEKADANVDVESFSASCKALQVTTNFCPLAYQK